MVRDGGFDVITKAQATTITQGPEGVVVEQAMEAPITVAPESSRYR